MSAMRVSAASVACFSFGIALVGCGGAELSFPRDAVLLESKACASESALAFEPLEITLKSDQNRVLTGLVVKNRSETERKLRPDHFSIESGSCRFPEAKSAKGEIKGPSGGPAPLVTLKPGETMELAMSSDFGVRPYESCTKVSIAFHAEVDGAIGCEALGTWVMAE